MTIEDKINKLNEKIEALNYDFKDPQIKSDAEGLKQAAIEYLEGYLELVEEDES